MNYAVKIERFDPSLPENRAISGPHQETNFYIRLTNESGREARAYAWNKYRYSKNFFDKKKLYCGFYTERDSSVQDEYVFNYVLGMANRQEIVGISEMELKLQWIPNMPIEVEVVSQK